MIGASKMSLLCTPASDTRSGQYRTKSIYQILPNIHVIKPSYPENFQKHFVDLTAREHLLRPPMQTLGVERLILIQWVQHTESNLFDAMRARISDLRKAESDEIPPASSASAMCALKIATATAALFFVPNRIVTTNDGGIVFCYFGEEQLPDKAHVRYATLECTSEGEIFALKGDRISNEVESFEVCEIEEALIDIRHYVRRDH